MIIPSKSLEIHTKAHYKPHTSHSHSNENQKHITRPSPKELQNHSQSFLSPLLQPSMNDTTRPHSTIPSQLKQPPKPPTTPSIPLPNIKMNPNHHPSPFPHSTPSNDHPTAHPHSSSHPTTIQHTKTLNFKNRGFAPNTNPLFHSLILYTVYI